LANQTENAAEVIRKDDTRKPTAVDESRGMENIFVLIRDLLRTLGIIQGDLFGFLISLAFIDLKQFAGNVLKTTVQSWH
jgi:hypothetical protein